MSEKLKKVCGKFADARPQNNNKKKQLKLEKNSTLVRWKQIGWNWRRRHSPQKLIGRISPEFWSWEFQGDDARLILL